MPEEQVAALVVMRPAGAVADESEGQAATERVAPAPEDVTRTRRYFASRGFAVGPIVGISFSIAAPRERMERLFGDFGRLEGTGGELSLAALPGDVRRAVRAVVSEVPPAFGPGNP